jgi:hypothetical protein
MDWWCTYSVAAEICSLKTLRTWPPFSGDMQPFKEESSCCLAWQSPTVAGFLCSCWHLLLQRCCSLLLLQRCCSFLVLLLRI